MNGPLRKRKFRRLSGRGKPKTVVTTAIARELIGFIWAIDREVNLQGKEGSMHLII